jgi:hypothetical protein|tara:strand:+ start:124 stop:402 length:279 start_codon:yes stop_codon:yes gene_type:complete
MVKSYKAFIKEYSMGLQVPSTSYLKGVGSLRNLTKKETSTNNTAMDDATPAPVITLPKKKNEVSDKLKGKVLDRKIKRMKTKVYTKKFLTRP